MVHNLITLALFVSGLLAGFNSCFGGEYTIISLDGPSCFDATPCETLKIFFEEKEEQYVRAALITDGSRNLRIKNIHQLLHLSNKDYFKENFSLFSVDKRGAFVPYGESNPSVKYKFVCRNGPHGKDEYFYIRYIHHTGLTEGLLDMPECSVRLESDYAAIELKNSIGPQSTQTMFSINPDKVQALRNRCLASKVFVIKMKQYPNEEPTEYKVMHYTNNAYVQWNSWIPRFILRWAGKHLQLEGFEKPEDVIPTEEITINGVEESTYQPTYDKNKKIGKFAKFLSIGSVLFVVCYLLKDTITEISWK